jgi:predicted RNase H-like nuclease (RuvC/YqgF family)
MNTDVTKMAFFANTDPELITVDFVQHEATAKAAREARDLANPPKPEPAQVEYDGLLHRLFNLTEAAQNTEIYANNIAGNVKQLENQLDAAIKQKKRYAEAGNERAARNGEHHIQRLERELADQEKDLKRAKNNSANAARALKAFDGHPRLKELKKQLAL